MIVSMRLLSLTLFLACGCASKSAPADLGPDLSLSTDGFATFDLSGTMSGSTTVVYAHSASRLYSIDPTTLAINPIGPFKFSGPAMEITDIALDKNGKMLGITTAALYTIDPATAVCTFLASFQGSDFNALSFIASDQVAGGEEILVGAAVDANLYRIDPTTGVQTKIGNYGAGLKSSGDLVSVEGATYATALGTSDTTDTLFKIDPSTGTATPIGDTGYGRIYGLGYWRQQLFGFTNDGQFLIINVTTGAATPVKTGTSSWNGAGVTTSAPITVL